MTLIQVRGTSGSGKTTAIREAMRRLGPWDSYQAVAFSRRKPAYYALRDKRLAVLGHYESPCGGCDTFKGYAQLQAVVREALGACQSVLMEGLMLSDDVKQTLEIAQLGPLRVLYLTTPLNVCIERVKQRRATKGRDGVFNETKLRNRAEQIERTRLRLKAAGIECIRCAPEQAVGHIRKLLGL